MKSFITQHLLRSCAAVFIGLLLQLDGHSLLAQETPATNQVPEQAWGPVCEGFRLAVVFPKNAFTNGEPIIGKVVVHNVTDVYLSYYGNVPSYKELVVRTERKEILELKEALRPKTPFEERMAEVAINPQPVDVAPGGESTFSIRLDDRYDMSAPGTYLVLFGLTVHKRADLKHNAQAVTVVVPIRVLKK